MPGGFHLARDPKAEPRTRRALDQLSKVLNDLLDEGSIIYKPGGTWGINPTPPSPPVVASFPPSGVFDFGSDQDETLTMPGPKGDTGATGATGSTGPPGPSGSGGGAGGMMPGDFEVDELPRPVGLLTVHDYDLALTDITTNNVTSARHGFVPKIPADATKFLDGTGAFTIPTGTGATAADLRFAQRAAIYLPFTTGTDAYEFTGSDLANFTAVDPGSNTPTTTESNDTLSVAVPGGDTATILHAWMKAVTINANDYVEAWVSCVTKSGTGPQCGVIMSDGHTYGAGTQMKFGFDTTVNTRLGLITNFNTTGTGGNQAIYLVWASGIGIRLKYLGSNNWEGYISLDGITWALVQSQTKTLTPSEYGFYVANSVTEPTVINFRYIRKGS